MVQLHDVRVLHITNNLGYGGVQKIIYELCDTTRQSLSNVCVASSGGVYVDRLGKIGIQHYEIPDVSSKNPKDIVSIIRILSRIVREQNINVIQCHHRMAVLFARMLHTDAHIIYVNHTTYSDKGLFTRLILRNVPVVAVGEQAKNNAENFFHVPGNRITVIPNAIAEYDGEFVQIPQIEDERAKGKFIVTNVGRLHQQKGMRYFVEAAAKCIDDGLNIAFFIVGDGPLREELEHQVADLGLADHVHFMGFREDAANVMYQSDVLAMSSLYEGLPLTPIEACSVGKAVIAPDIEGVREVVQDGVNGILYEPRNPDALFQGITTLYRDRDLLKSYGKQAKLVFRRKFGIQPFKDAYLKYYEAL